MIIYQSFMCKLYFCQFNLKYLIEYLPKRYCLILGDKFDAYYLCLVKVRTEAHKGPFGTSI